MNKIFIKNYKVQAKHGYYKEEHFKKQSFVVSVICEVVENQSGKNDELGETLNYEFLRESVNKVLLGEGKKLLEYLSENIAMLILTNKKVKNVEIEITKPDIWGDCEPGVFIIRQNK